MTKDRKNAWDAISLERYAEIWNQIRAALNPGGRKQNVAEFLDRLTQDEKAALFNRLCCDYGKCVLLDSDSKRKTKLLVELESALDLMNDMFEERHVKTPRSSPR